MISSSLFTFALALILGEGCLASHVPGHIDLQPRAKMQPRSQIVPSSRHFRRTDTCIPCSDGNGCCDTGLTCVMFGEMAGCCPNGQDCSDSADDTDTKNWDGEVDGPDGDVYNEKTDDIVITVDDSIPDPTTNQATPDSSTGASRSESSTSSSDASSTDGNEQPSTDATPLSTDDSSSDSTSTEAAEPVDDNSVIPIDESSSISVDDSSSLVSRSWWSRLGPWSWYIPSTDASTDSDSVDNNSSILGDDSSTLVARSWWSREWSWRKTTESQGL
ncbi:hypothetical protein C8J56DRAFT_1040214 [Mycena floridula]|nr:hypothetical protein C8J56DRAFT_1040214 [Mycena floridula]